MDGALAGFDYATSLATRECASSCLRVPTIVFDGLIEEARQKAVQRLCAVEARVIELSAPLTAFRIAAVEASHAAVKKDSGFRLAFHAQA